MDRKVEARCQKWLQHLSQIFFRDGPTGLSFHVVFAFVEPFRTAENLRRLHSVRLDNQPLQGDVLAREVGRPDGNLVVVVLADRLRASLHGRHIEGLGMREGRHESKDCERTDGLAPDWTDYQSD